MAVDVADTRAGYDWRLPGCGPYCRPGAHDPLAHEEYGRRQERGLLQVPVVRTGSLAVDLVRDIATVDGDEVHLSVREWDLLVYLAAWVGVWRTLDEIVEAVWGPEWVPSSGTLMSTTVNRLRTRLGPAGALIETQPSGRMMRRLRAVPT